MQTKRRKLSLLKGMPRIILSFFTPLCLGFFFQSSLSAQIIVKQAGIGLVEDVVYFNSVRALTPGKPWKTLAPSDDIEQFGQLKFPYASFPEFDIEVLDVYRTGDRHSKTVLSVSGKRSCGFLLDYCFSVYGEKLNPLERGKDSYLFEWVVDENFAQQKAIYRYSNKVCTLQVQIID